MPRLASFLAASPGVNVRLSASTVYSDFAADGFDADIVYGKPDRPGLAVLGLGEEELTPLCTPSLATRLRAPADLALLPLIDSDNKQFRWSDWGKVNDLPPWPQAAMRFDRSFMAIAAAADGLGVALESTRLAEGELKSGRLVRVLPGMTRSIHYTGHHLVFPMAVRHRAQLRQFASWLGGELGVALVDFWT
jgi:DNA-binding transcriptional LysR family regulator